MRYLVIFAVVYLSLNVGLAVSHLKRIADALEELVPDDEDEEDEDAEESEVEK